MRQERILLNLSIENRVDRFITLAEKYTNMCELTPEIIRTFIAKIVIHERPVKWKNDGEQQIDIYFTHIRTLSA